jgi:hypothetical protein
MRRVSHEPVVDSWGNELVERQLPAGGRERGSRGYSWNSFPGNSG